MTVTSAADLYELENTNNADYPFTPATPHELLDADATRDLWNHGFRVFGAYGRDELVGATLNTHRDRHAETECTSVLAS
ncbi:hypothetical protein [Cryobacterium lyxosi]|uniref:Uncharacterized protein n=1 Tax=Cryobacterium lyxosi TaxID=1259228 RepID=A0A4R8ZK52_9MICO|nr:hypothetical protein [Cryobacterium lyxosi]TFD28632.1 hypothetical protein E3T27_01690 [Cryobacterium lyxosi]